MAKATTKTSTTKPASASTKGKKTETVARPAIGKDDKDLKAEQKQAASTPTSASKKRKSPSTSTTTDSTTPAAKDPEHDLETLKNTEKNSKSKTKGIPTTSATTRSEDDHATTSTSSSNKRTKVSVNSPAVTLEKTVEELELPKVTKSTKSKKPTTTTTTTSTDSISNVVAPSSTKPAKGLKSALKPTSSSKKPTTTKDIEMKDPEFIHGFSSSSENGGDSSDEDDSDVDMDAAGAEKSTIKAKDLPNVVEGDKEVQEKLGKAKKRSGKEKGVLYLGRIPHGFYEDEMKAYFSQFGDVSRLRLARNKKTGASKHFAYIEMPNKSVAEITAETMHNYLLMGHILQCHVIPNDKIHPDLWIGANRKWRRVPSARLERSTFGKERTTEEQTKTRAKLANREKGRKDKIKAAGIDYEYEGFTA